MIIIQFSGGLGNQMFQYALYKKLELREKEVFADRNFYKIYPKVKYDLDIFQLEIKEAELNHKLKLADTQNGFTNKVRRKLCGRRKSWYKEKESGRFDKDVFELTNAYLEGYWQSEKYFCDIRDEIIKAFTFKDSKSSKNIEMLQLILGSNSVSIHIRRGDYLSEQNLEIYGGICTIEYYKKAAQFIEKRIDSPTFFVFSNDIEWVKRHFFLKNAYYIDWNQNDENYYDMYLMSKCRHNIIANSSFSWWGAWLNQNKEKLIISPPKWFNKREAPDIICEDWIREI